MDGIISISIVDNTQEMLCHNPYHIRSQHFPHSARASPQKLVGQYWYIDDVEGEVGQGWGDIDARLFVQRKEGGDWEEGGVVLVVMSVWGRLDLGLIRLEERG